jgi:hypothetical protein
MVRASADAFPSVMHASHCVCLWTNRDGIVGEVCKLAWIFGVRGEQGQSAGAEVVLSRASVLTEHSLAQPPHQPLSGHDRGTAPP